MRKKGFSIFFTSIIAILLILLTGCPQPNGTVNTEVIFESVTQIGGTTGTANTTGLTLTFNVDPTTLTVDNIKLTGATKGELSGTGKTRILTVSDITVANDETLTVTVTNPVGFNINSATQTAVVYKDKRTKVTFSSVVQTGGTTGTANTTGLTLTFDSEPTGLTADNITLTGATKGTLSGTGKTRTLTISNITVANGATVSVALTSPNGLLISDSPKTAVVYKDTRAAVTFSSAVQIGGTAGTANTTGLTLTFDAEPTGLTTDNITLTGATKGTLSGTGKTRTLTISNITVANGATVSVALTSPNGLLISGSPKTTVVYKDTRIAVTFSSVVQIGSAESTALTLSFNAEPANLTADNITLTGATKGALSGTGTTRTLEISNITVASGETVTITITNPTGYLINESTKTAVVYKASNTFSINGTVYQISKISSCYGADYQRFSFTAADNSTYLDMYFGTSSHIPVGEWSVVNSATVVAGKSYNLVSNTNTRIVHTVNSGTFNVLGTCSAVGADGKGTGNINISGTVETNEGPVKLSCFGAYNFVAD